MIDHFLLHNNNLVSYIFKKMKELDIKEEIINKKIETKVPASSSYLLVEDKLSVL